MGNVSLLSSSGISDRSITPSEIFGKISLQRLGCPPHPERCILFSEKFCNLTHKFAALANLCFQRGILQMAQKHELTISKLKLGHLSHAEWVVT